MSETIEAFEIQWSDDFLIGIAELDFEHQRLIEDINSLHRILREAADAATARQVFGSLHSRMQAHFALEEQVMLSKKYRHYDEHKAEHENLLDEYTELMTRYQRAPEAQDRASLEKVLSQWIVGHILKSDKKMSAMIGGD
jgi:hemerythrin-like metal-binding protein